MRILVVTPAYGGVTGLGTACRGLTEALSALGHVVDVFHHLPGRTSAVTVVDHAGAHRRPRPLEQVLERPRGYDIVHFHGDASSDGRGGGFSRIVRRYRSPAIVTLHSVAREHQVALDSTPSRVEAQVAIEASLIERADRIIMLSDSAARALSARRPHLAHRLRVVGNGVQPPPPPPGAEDTRARLGWGPEHQVVTFLGRLSREKGVDVLAEAFIALHRTRPRARLLVAGPAADQSAEIAQSKLRKAGLPQDTFHFMGAVHPSERHAPLRAADLVVLPSRVEQLPLVALEAMAVGRPVLVSALPSLSEVFALEDPSRQLAFSMPAPPTPAAVAAAIAAALEAPDREAVARRARDATRSRFSWRAVAEATVRVYEEALESPAAAPPARALDAVERRLERASAEADAQGASVEDRAELAAVELNLARVACGTETPSEQARAALRAAAEKVWALEPRPDLEPAEVAVVIPVYLPDAEDPRLGYLREALDSVFEQDLEAAIAAVVVDDGSQVDLRGALRRSHGARLETVLDQAGDLHRFGGRGLHLIERPHWGHPGWARREGYRWAAITRTPFVAHLDSDDRMLPDRLRKTLAHLRAHPSVDLVHAAHRSIDARGSSLEGDNPVDRWFAGRRIALFGLDPTNEAQLGAHHRHPPALLARLPQGNFIHNATVLMRTRALLEVGLEDLAPAAPAGHEDHELWMKLSRLARFDYLNEVVALYRQHGESLTGRASPERPRDETSPEAPRGAERPPLDLPAGREVAARESGATPARSGAMKLGFLFLTRDHVYHPDIWGEFFEEEIGRRCVLRMHPKPDRIDRIPPGWRAHVVRDPLPTAWGTASLVRAMNHLLRSALADPSVQRFVLLSESTIPVRRFDEVYARLAAEERSLFFYASDDECWPRCAPLLEHLPRDQIKKTHQWAILNRRHAELIVEHERHVEWFEDIFAPDEHAWICTLHRLGLGPEITHALTTYVDWTRGRPRTFETLSSEQEEEIIASGALFARKFPPGAAARRLWHRARACAGCER